MPGKKTTKIEILLWIKQNSFHMLEIGRKILGGIYKISTMLQCKILKCNVYFLRIGFFLCTPSVLFI